MNQTTHHPNQSQLSAPNSNDNTLKSNSKLSTRKKSKQIYIETRQAAIFIYDSVCTENEKRWKD